MNPRAKTLAVLGVLSGTAAFGWLLWLLAEASRRPPRSPWLAVLWGASLLLATMALGRASRFVRAAAAFALALSMATLTEGPSASSMWSLVSLFVALGLAQLVGLPTYAGRRATTSQLPDILMTEQDLRRLSRLLSQLPTSARITLADLEREIARAKVVPSEAVPPDVVTMNSRLVYEELESGARSEVVLVYPQDENASEGRISVLEPVGSALLGLSVGQCIEWRTPARRCHFRVLQIKYQPEAAGDFHL